MKLVVLSLLFLTSCNEAMRSLTPEQQERVRSYIATEVPRSEPPPEKMTNLQKLDLKIKDQETYSKGFGMTCTNDLVTDPSSVAIYRCENSEVVCYSEHRGGMICRFK